jgi:type VI secretion system secreted protein Hcp
MAYDAFLKIDGIEGESTAEGHEKWIELLSFSWGVAAAVAAGGGGPGGGGGGGGGGAGGRASPQPFSFTKVTDSASPNIFVKLCEGVHFQKVSLACRKAGGTVAGTPPPDDFIKFDFFDVFFSSFNEGGNGGTDQLPLESISFVFSKIELQVAAMAPDGSLGAVSMAGFDFRTNKPFQPPTSSP